MSIISCAPNPYTNVCTSILYSLIDGVTSLQIPLYQQVYEYPSNDDTTIQSLFTMIYFPFHDAKWLCCESYQDGSIAFRGVNLSDSAVLISSYNIVNVIPVPIVSYRGTIYLKYKNKPYRMFFSVPQIDQLIPIKKKIQNLFEEDIKAYVLYDKLVLIFVRSALENSVENGDQMASVYRLMYVASFDFEHPLNSIVPMTMFDYANGTLVAMINKRPYMFYNRYGLNSCNFYPFTSFTFTYPALSANYIISGGLNNYLIQPDTTNMTDPSFLWKINMAGELQYQAQEFVTDDTWGYAPVRQLIQIPNVCDTEGQNTGPIFIFAFNNETNPDLVFFGFTDMLNTDNTIVTFPLPLESTVQTDAYDWYRYPANATDSPSPDNGVLYFYLVCNAGESTRLVIYGPSFASFMKQYKGSISISDLDFSNEINNRISLKFYPFDTTIPHSSSATYIADHVFFTSHGHVAHHSTSQTEHDSSHKFGKPLKNSKECQNDVYVNNSQKHTRNVSVLDDHDMPSITPVRQTMKSPMHEKYDGRFGGVRGYWR